MSVVLDSPSLFWSGRFPSFTESAALHSGKCVHWSLSTKVQVQRSTCGLVAMTSASHAEGRQFDPGQVYALWRVREN